MIGISRFQGGVVIRVETRQAQAVRVRPLVGDVQPARQLGDGSRLLELGFFVIRFRLGFRFFGVGALRFWRLGGLMLLIGGDGDGLRACCECG